MEGILDIWMAVYQYCVITSTVLESFSRDSDIKNCSMHSRHCIADFDCNIDFVQMAQLSDCSISVVRSWNAYLGLSIPCIREIQYRPPRGLSPYRCTHCWQNMCPTWSMARNSPTPCIREIQRHRRSVKYLYG